MEVILKSVSQIILDACLSQRTIALLFLLVFAVYIFPKVIETTISKYLSKFLPCNLTVQRFGFVYAHGIFINFINGEIIYIDAIDFKSSLWDSSANSLFTFIVERVDFQTTHEGLYSLLQALRQKNENVRLRNLNRPVNTPWIDSFLCGMLRFTSITVCNLRVGIWPSVQLADDNSLWQNHERGRSPKHSTFFARSPLDSSSAEDMPEEQIELNYLDWATDRKIAATLLFTAGIFSFYVDTDFLHVRFNGGRVCGKLFSTSDSPEFTQFLLQSTQEKNACTKFGVLLGHVRLYSTIDLVFERKHCTEANTLTNDVRPGPIIWRPRSVCMEFYAVRAAILEELLEILRQRLAMHPPSPMPGAEQSSMNHLVTGFHQSPNYGIPSNVDEDRKYSSGLTCLQQQQQQKRKRGCFWLPQHLCLSVLPQRRPCLPSDHEVKLRRLGVHPPDGNEIGFLFELIRIVFRRSLQIKLVSFKAAFESSVQHWPVVRSSAEAISSPFAYRLSRFSLFSAGLRRSQRMNYRNPCEYVNGDFTSSLRSNTSHLEMDDPIPATPYKVNFEPSTNSEFSSSKTANSSSPASDPVPVEAASMFGRLRVVEFHVISGWDNDQHCCALDYRLPFLELALQEGRECRRSLWVLPRTQWSSKLGHRSSGYSSSSFVRGLDRSAHRQKVESVQDQLSVANGSSESKLAKPLRYLGLDRGNLLISLFLGDPEASPDFSSQDMFSPETSQRFDGWMDNRNLTGFGVIPPQSSEHSNASIRAPQMVFILVPHSSSPALQFGLDRLAMNIRSGLSGISVSKLFDSFFRSESELSISGLHVCLFGPQRLQGVEWPPVQDHQVTYSAPEDSSVRLPPNTGSPSEYLNRRSLPHLFDKLSQSSPILEKHEWGHLLDLVKLTVRTRNRLITYHIKGVQMEWPTDELRQFSCHLPCLFSCLIRGAPGLTGTSFLSNIQDLKCGDPCRPLRKPVQLSGQLDKINLFLVSSNDALLMMRVDSIESASHLSEVACPPGALSWTDVYAYQINARVLSVKVLYDIRKPLSSVESPSEDHARTVHYPLLPCSDLQHQLFWVPDYHFQINNQEKAVLMTCPQPGEMLWTPALHLCFREAFQTAKDLISLFPLQRKRLFCQNQIGSVCTIPSGAVQFWTVQLKAPASIQLFVQLITTDHQLAICLKNLEIRLLVLRGEVDTTDPVSATSGLACEPTPTSEQLPCPLSRFKLNCESALVRCDSDNIFAFKHLSLRKRPATSQHRTGHTKWDLITQANSTWEWAADLCYITFPYRYCFRDTYLDTTSLIKYLCQLHNLGSSSETKSMSSGTPDSVFYADGDTDMARARSNLHASGHDCEDYSLISTQSSPHRPVVVNKASPAPAVRSMQLDSVQSSNSVPLLRPDYIVRFKRFILEVKDDPFECKLNDHHMVLLDEQMKHEQQVATLHDQLQWATTSGIRLSEADRQACFARLEYERVTEYRAHLTRFNQDFPIADELFTWTLDNVQLKSLADHAFATPEQIIDHIRSMDSCSPWPDFTAFDFCTLWCRMISLNVDCWRFHMRDYPTPWLEMSDLFLWGQLAGAERTPDWRGQRTVCISPGKPWPDCTITRNCWPLKFYYDLSADLKALNMCYGSNWEPTLSWLNQRWDDIFPRGRDPSVPRLGWWDKVRHILHGRLYFVSESMQWLYSTSFNPYNSTEFFAWQWSQCTVRWETAHFRLEGDLDISYRTAYKYDGICRLISLPSLEMDINLDWLSLRDPFDHHSVSPCDGERIEKLRIIGHDSYRYFRGNRLAIQISCTVRPSGLTGKKPSCLFYTSVLKFADKLRMCLARVARPIRRGSLFLNTPPRKPNFSRLLQSVDFSFSLPQLELTYWVSYAKRTGVRATTGPIQMMAELRNSIALESKVHLDSRRGSSPHQYVMMPPMNSYQQSGLIRRTSSVWSVVRLSATMHDSRIRLVHHPDLPGQVVQMLMKSARQIQAEYKAFNPTGSAQFPWMEDAVDGIDVDSAEDFIMVPLLRYEQVTPSQLPSGVSVRVHIPGRRSNSNSMNTSFAETAPRENEVQIGNIISTNVGTKHSEEKTDLKVPPAAECINLSHETLTPTHRLEMSDLKLRWTEHNRNLVYTLMDTYQHAKSLKRNLSARATHGFQLRTNQSGPGTALNRVRSSGAINSQGFRSSGPISGPSTMPNLNARVQDQRDAISLAAHSERIMRDEEFLEIPSISVDKMNSAHQNVHPKTPAHAPVCPTTAHSAICISETDDQLSYLTPQNWESQSISDHGLAPGLADIPMLAQLLEEVDTARFYAYCEEEPKQTDVVGQLQGLAICASSLVSARNWHVELINSQLLLKTDNLTGYVLVTAARAKLDALAHPPVWRDSQLLAKSSLVGHLECMQYYATVGKVDPGTPNQWLSTGDVSDWVHFNPNADEDALSGRPEVVGCGRSVGGVVNACVSCRPTDPSSLLSGVTAIQSDPIPHRPSVGTPGKPSRPIQLQRMISRCSCQVFYVHYEPADPSEIPTHLIPSLPLDESEVVSTQEGGDTVTLLHHTLNICTNSLQYHMIVDIVNDLLLYVEPQRKAQSERNRVEFGLMSESQVRVAILRDQEALRYFVADQRRLERYLWSFVKQTMSSLNLDANASGIFNEPVGPQDLSDLARAKHSSDNALKLSVCIECARQIETQIANLKTKIVSRNAILSQRLAHYQQLQIQAQRQHMRVAMNARSHSSSDMRVSSQASSSSASLLKQRKVDDTLVLSCANSINPDGRSLGHGGVQTSSSPEPSKSVLSSQIGDVRVSADPNASISVSKHIAVEHKHDSYPAEVVRRSEVCFEHASWRMTENDGQIGLADVELRGFLYAKTHRQDDSGSHWLELGWIRVASLAPDSFYKEVLAPDVVGGHYAGGPILRIACSELPPVGGLSVKGAMEISVAPMSLQISKQFYRIMMPYFFPEKSEESDTATTESVNGTVDKALDSTATGSGDRQSHHILIPDLPDSGPTDSRDNSGSMVPPTLSSSSPTQSPVTSAIAQRSTGWIRRRLYQPQNLLRYLYRGGGGSHTVPPPPILPPGAGSAARLDESSSPNSRTRKSPRSSDTPESNLTVEAALAGQTNCNVDGSSEAENVLGIELNRIALHQRRMQWRKHVQGEFDPFPFQPSPFTGDLSSDLPLHSFLNTIFALQQHQAASWPLSVMPPMDIASLMSSLVEDLKELNSLSNNPPAPDSSFLTGDASNPVDVMRERARQNNVFLYIKIPGFPICLSYKGEKQKNLTDVTRFELNIPTLEYHNCVWTWLDFVMEVKTRIRKQLVREVIKKKFTPRRHIPFVRLGRAKSDRSLNLPISSARTSQLSSLGSSSTADVVDVASSAAQEERVRREVEMLLGRHAQPQVPRPGRRWPHLRTHRS